MPAKLGCGYENGWHRPSSLFLDLLLPVRQHLTKLFLTPFRDNDFLQHITTVEHILTHFHHTCREENGSQLVAKGKCSVSDAHHPLGNRYRWQTYTLHESVIANGANGWGIVIVSSVRHSAQHPSGISGMRPIIPRCRHGFSHFKHHL